ncbi:MAG: ABC transporter substrate-binding protein [Thermoplasmata archaeon]
MNKKTGKLLIATILVAIVLISGFSVLSQGATVSQKSSSSGTLYIAMQQDIPNYNYFNLPSNTVWKTDVIGWDWDTLYIMDYSGAMVPYLAQNATFNATSLTLTVTLRQGVYFVWPINGTPAYEMTAKDVVFSYFAERFGTTVSGTAFTVPFDDQNYGYVTYQEMLRHVRYINQWTVQFTMCRPYAQFFLDTMSMPIIPWQIWQNHLVTTGNPNDNNNPVFVNPNGSTNGIVDTSWTESPLATMGTSIFYYAGGLRNSYEYINLNTNFWGKNWVSPSGYHVYPQNISQIYFKIYTTLDTAVLALETGDVDYIAWSVPGSYVPTLSQDPQINIFRSPDDGYFYLAFNMAQQPMNDIHFRQAVSHLIDKNTIVESYMSGIGQAGDSTEPPFFTSWYNSSVVRYAFDPANASAILNASGYVMGPSGWRLLPNGQPMPPITILTPPADYDPIRVKIGEALAAEMRSVGIDAQAKAINFDALVAEMSAYQYQMLTLGWSLSTDPLGNLADIYGINAPENYEAFWPSNYTNPNFPTIVSLADPTSSAMAWQFQNVIDTAQTSFNTNTQIYYAKWAQGILSEAVPVNVLYYEINVEATLNVWSGWFSWEGSIYNIYSLASLHPSSVSTGVGAPTTTTSTHVGNIIPPSTSQYLVTQLINPGKVFINQPQFKVSPSISNVPVSVLVTNNYGIPVPQASVTLSASGSGGISISTSSGLTNSAGIFTTYVTGKSPGYVNLTAASSYNGMSATAKSIIQSVQFVPSILFTNAYVSEPSILPGQSTNVIVNVMDEYGNPVANANVSIATNLLGYGTISPSYAFTNSTGYATFTFTAPSANEMKTTFVNQNLESKVMLSTSKPGYTIGNTVSLVIVTYNPYPSSWIQVHVVNATNWFVNQNNLKTTVEIQATNAQNMPIANVALKIAASNETYINSGTPSSITTGPNGYANVTIVFNSNLPTAGVSVKFFNSTYVNSTSDALTIAYVNGPVPSNLFGGYVAFYDGVTGARTNFVSIAGGNADDQVVVHIFNSNNQPVSGSIPVGLVFTAAPEGALVGFYDPMWSSPIDYYFNSLWEYEGININTTYMGFLPPVSGVFVSQLDNQIADPTLGSWLGVSALTAYQYVYYGYGINVNDSYIINGTGSYYINGIMSPLVDRISNVYVIPYSYTYYPQTPGIYPSGVIISAGDFYTHGSEYIASQLAIQRAPDIRITTFQINNPFAMSSSEINATATLLNASDMPVANQSIWFYSAALVPNPSFINYGAPAPAWNYTTNSDGTVSVSLPVATATALSSNDLYIVWNLQPGYPKPGASSVWGIGAITESTQIISVPIQATIMATATDYTLPYQSTSIININVLNENGEPINGASLGISASSGNVTGSTYSNTAGEGTIYVTPVNSLVNGNPYTVDVIKIKASGSDFLAGTFTLVIIAHSSQPQITLTNLMPSQVVTTSSYTLNGTVWDPAGIKSLIIYLDTPNNAYPVTPTEISNGEYSWSVQISNFFNNLNAVFVNATNNNNVTTITPQFFYYQPPVSYVTSTQFNSTVTHLNSTLVKTNTTMTKSLSNYFSTSAGYTSLVLGILAIIIALIALALAARKPKKPGVKETPEEKPATGEETTEEKHEPEGEKPS